MKLTLLVICLHKEGMFLIAQIWGVRRFDLQPGWQYHGVNVVIGPSPV